MAGEMLGRVCLITGATNGIGKATALALASMDATLVIVARDQARGEAALADIRRRGGGGQAELLLADLSSQRSIRELAQRFTASYPHLHVLINNAGAVFAKRQLSPDGIEMTFALDHLAYFLLTDLLLDTLKAGAPARIINVSSAVQNANVINFDDLQGARAYRAFGAYSQAKLANVLFTYELATRLAGSGVTANCLHPGVVRTGFGGNNGGLIGLGTRLMAPFILSPEKGAATTIYLASSPKVEGVTGKYWVKKAVARSAPLSYDRAAQQRLWRISAEMTGLEARAGA